MQRNSLLTQTGHSYLNVALPVAALLELVAVLALAVRHFRAAREGGPTLRLSFPQLAARLATVQAAAFTTLEIAERIRSGTPVGEMFQNHLFPIGVVIQLLVALTGALLLCWVARTAQAMGARLRPGRSFKRTPGIQLPQVHCLPTSSAHCLASRGRAPPLLLSLR
jgi:hypothetical protein